MDVKQLGDDVFQVESESSTKSYLVTWATEEIHGWPDHWSCTCTNYAIQRNKKVSAGETTPYQCKHIREVVATQPVRTKAITDSLRALEKSLRD